MERVSSRYSEEDLAEFKTLVEGLVEKGMRKLEGLEEDYKDAAEAIDNEGDWMDDSSSQNDLGMLQTLVFRQRKHVNDLQNALQRIYNKSYGICIVTGELIDKRRLLAVPTTTKSIEGKNLSAAPTKKVVKKDDDEDKPKPKAKGEPVIITRVIKKSNAVPKVVEDDEEEGFEEEDLDDIYDESAEEEFDLDSLAADNGDD